MAGIIFGIIGIILTLMFWSAVWDAVAAVTAAACKLDHEHGAANHWMKCRCKCHKAGAKVPPR